MLQEFKLTLNIFQKISKSKNFQKILNEFWNLLQFDEALINMLYILINYLQNLKILTKF